MDPESVKTAALVQGKGPAMIIGGMILDLQATAEAGQRLRRGGSVPGSVLQTPGGVARNVAHTLTILCRQSGVPLPLLLSVLGDDLAGDALLGHWQSSVQAPDRCITRVAGVSTPVVSIILDSGGEVEACVADVATLEQELTPQLLETFRDDIIHAPLVMLDGNLSEAALQAACRIASEAGIPIWFEPVSEPKSVRATAVLRHITFISPNAAELVEMAAAVKRRRETGTHLGYKGAVTSAAVDVAATTYDGRQSARQTIGQLLPSLQTLLEEGVRYIIVTLGVLGAALCMLRGGSIHIAHMPALPAVVVNTSGAGDSLVAGALAALLIGATPINALAHGLAVAHFTVQCKGNVAEDRNSSEIASSVVIALDTLQEWSEPINVPSSKL